MDKKLFRRSTRNAEQEKITECLFADDGVLISATRPGAERAVLAYQAASTSFGLTVSIAKTKHMTVGREATESDKAPIIVVGGEIEAVEEFPYLGSVISTSGTIDADVEARIAKASRAFGALCKPVFLDKNLTLHTKRIVYNACVLSVLLYGSECWTPLRRHTRKLNTFHQQNIRRIMGTSNLEQWTKRITMAEIRRRWGNCEPVSGKVIKRRLQWLGHLARMKNTRLPKKSPFGWLCQPCPQSGPKRRWRDVIRRDLRDINISESEWYDEATSSRADWRALCGLGLEDRRKQIITASCSQLPGKFSVKCVTEPSAGKVT